MFRSESIASDAESTASELFKDKDDTFSTTSGGRESKDTAPLTPATSVASTPSSMFPPPPIDKPSSRRSSFSGSQAPSSPSTFNRYGRSPSPMPPLPAIRTSLPTPSAWGSVKLYGDESFTNFFRRLTFSPDGGLLLTPAGQFEDPSVLPGSSKASSSMAKSDDAGTPVRGRRGRPSISTTDITPPAASASSVYIYSRANFARPPIAQLPGHKKASVAVRFSPILYELRQGVEGADAAHETKTAALEKGTEGTVDVDITGPLPMSEGKEFASSTLMTPQRTPSNSQTLSIATPSPMVAGSMTAYNVMASPALSPMDLRPPTPAASKPSTPAPAASHATSGLNLTTGSMFALPYRMLFAVVTMDTVAIYDTQQAGPVCMLTKLHYDEFTDLTWYILSVYLGLSNIILTFLFLGHRMDSA